LIIKAFNTPYYLSATSGIRQTAKYQIKEGRTFLAPNMHLFKHDLKLLNPKAGAKLSTSEQSKLSSLIHARDGTFGQSLLIASLFTKFPFPELLGFLCLSWRNTCESQCET
jgi:hypothetical protein